MATNIIVKTELPIVLTYGYDAVTLMKETSNLRKIITKRGTFEILIPISRLFDS